MFGSHSIAVNLWKGVIDLAFSASTRGRCWVVTFHIANMEKSGLGKEEYENPEHLAEYICDLWENSGKGRKAGVAVCVSLKGLYHAHIACYGNTTTLKKVSDTFFQAHTEPQLGGKAELRAYLLKEGKYAEKGEQVLCFKGLENIEDVQGKRNDLEEIEELLNNGATPEEIFEEAFRYRKYEKMIYAAYISKRVKEAPLKVNLYCELHIGNSSTGKTHTIEEIAEKEGINNIYVLNDFDNNASGGLDGYMKAGAPPILFIDEFKGYGISYEKLLTMLNGITKFQTHCRFQNAYNLWEKVIITSIYPPEELYRNMVPEENRNRDTFTQLLRRINVIVYHYINRDGKYRKYSMASCDYVGIDDIKKRAKEYEKYADEIEALENMQGCTSTIALEEFREQWGAVEVKE